MTICKKIDIHLDNLIEFIETKFKLKFQLQIH